MMGQEHLRNIALLPAARVAAIFEPDAAMGAAAQALDPERRPRRRRSTLLLEHERSTRW